MNAPVYSLGISPCPNDTFIFEALIHGRSPAAFRVKPHMADVEQLNLLAAKAELDITKLSLAAAARVLDRYILLGSGSALGRGCGPLLVSRRSLSADELRGASVAIPGAMTTANLLLSLTGRFAGPREEMVFDQVIPAVASGATDLGVIIHEGRFTYERQGLRLVLDLGQWWEETTGMPLPLGVIAIRRDLGLEAARQAQEAVRQSLLHARAHPEDGRPFIRANAQEMDEAVMSSHIRMFVNEFSLDLGEEGRSAVEALIREAGKVSGAALPPLPFFVGEPSHAH